MSIHQKIINAATRGELCRYPMIISIAKQVIKRIVNYDINSVLYDAYLDNLELLSENKKCWLYINMINDNVERNSKWYHGLEKLLQRPGSAKKRLQN